MLINIIILIIILIYKCFVFNRNRKLFFWPDDLIDSQYKQSCCPAEPVLALVAHRHDADTVLLFQLNHRPLSFRFPASQILGVFRQGCFRHHNKRENPGSNAGRSRRCVGGVSGKVFLTYPWTGCRSFRGPTPWCASSCRTGSIRGTDRRQSGGRACSCGFPWTRPSTDASRQSGPAGCA